MKVREALLKNIARIANAVQTGSVTINCQVTKIVMNLGSQLSELKSMSQRPQVSSIIIVIVIVKM